MQRLKFNKPNFAARFREADKGKGKSKKIRYILPIVLVVAILFGITGHYVWKTMMILQPELAVAVAYVSDPSTAEAYEQVLQTRRERERLQARVNNLIGAQANIESYPQMDRGVYDGFNSLRGATVSLTGYEFVQQDGSLTLYCTAPNALDASAYVAKLQAGELFDGVVYYGYDGEAGEESIYNFVVFCFVAPEGGEADE